MNYSFIKTTMLRNRVSNFQELRILIVSISSQFYVIKTCTLYRLSQNRTSMAQVSEMSHLCASILQLVISSPSRSTFPDTKVTDIEAEITKCFEEPKIWCNDKTKYRSIDGRCNNLNLRSFGMANTALFRVIAAQYDDGNLNKFSIFLEIEHN